MLPHQKTKPFACMEQGCSTSCCDDRSLHWHYEVKHSLCILNEAPPEEEARGDSSPAHEVAGQPAADGLQPLVPPEARSPGSLLPNRDPLRSTVSSMVHQEISSPGPVLAGPSDDREGKNTACPCPPSLGPYPCTPVAPGSLGTDVPEECHPLWKEPATGFTATHSRVAEDGGPDTAELERPPQLPPTLESGQEGGTLPAGLPLFQGQAAPDRAQPSNHNFQWLQNLPGCPESDGDDVFVIQKPTSVSPQEGSESGPRPSSTSLTGEASGCPGYAGEEGDTRASKKSDSDRDSCSRQHVEEPGLQEALKPSGLSSDATPLSGQLFLKSQESLDKRFSDFQKEKVKMDMCCEASPSKVAMASFSSVGPSVDPPQDSKPNLMISNRIQDGNTYWLPDPVKEESMADGCNQQNGGPADWAEPRSTYVCKNCSQMFHTEEGLTSHMCLPNDQWLSPQGNQDQQVALEALLLSRPQKPPTHPLADYHYTGSVVWTPMEKELFNKGFCVYKRNFSLIQKMATCSPQKRSNHHPTPELKTETESCRGECVITASPNAAPKQSRCLTRCGLAMPT